MYQYCNNADERLHLFDIPKTRIQSIKLLEQRIPISCFHMPFSSNYKWYHMLAACSSKIAKRNIQLGYHDSVNRVISWSPFPFIQTFRTIRNPKFRTRLSLRAFQHQSFPISPGNLSPTLHGQQ